MKKGDIATLKTNKTLHITNKIEKKEHTCFFLKYDEVNESIYFILEDEALEKMSLDAIYDCTIQSEKEVVKCTGRIVERYYDNQGQTIKIKIENGFYKINLK